MLDVEAVRNQFPALSRMVGGRPAGYLDGPGGTQVPKSVIDAMADFMRAGGSNHGGPFATSRETDAVAESARLAVADLFGASPDEIAFGQNMTSLTLSVSRALGATWTAGDNIIVTRLDHDANVWPWVIAARDAGAEVRWIDFDPDNGCRLKDDHLAELIDVRTRLVAVTHASNAVGTITDVHPFIEAAHAVGARTYVDAVHYSPHGLLDVAALGTDFLAASSYKFFGPHTGCLYGTTEALTNVAAYKIRPAPDEPPGKWETGTQSFESLAGITAAVDYIASLGNGPSRRDRIAVRDDDHRRIRKVHIGPIPRWNGSASPDHPLRARRSRSQDANVCGVRRRRPPRHRGLHTRRPRDLCVVRRLLRRRGDAPTRRR